MIHGPWCSKRTRRALGLGLVLAGLAGPVYALHPVGVLHDTWDGVALHGFDPVAYFTMGRAVKGSEEFTHTWLGSTWHFASAEHRDLFEADPVKYAPQYGGYCSDTVHAEGKVLINPEAFRIVNGLLYVFYSEPKADEWSGDPSAVAQAESYWETVKAGLGR